MGEGLRSDSLQRLAAFGLVWAIGALVSAQTPASLIVSAPEVRLVSGQGAQVYALARDRTGLPLRSTVTWTSSNASVLAVDANGVVTAKRLGVETITARLGGLSANVQMQSLPLRIEVYPRDLEVFAGQRVQYTALVLDINSAPIPDAQVSWEAIGPQGSPTNGIAVNNTGLMTASYPGRAGVRASIRYSTGNPQLVNQFVGSAEVNVKPRADYRITRLLSTDDVRSSFQLRPAYRSIAVNEAGQIAFLANLDGFNNGVMRYDNGRFDLLATTGTPGAGQQSIINNVDTPSINNRGDVLFRVESFGSGGSGLVLASQDGLSYLLFDGSPGPGFNSVGGFQLQHNSLSDNGEIVFAAGYRTTANTFGQGLFSFSNGLLSPVTLDSSSLPGLTGPYNFNEFAIDRNGVVYFVASGRTPDTRGVYRADRFSAPVKLLATGDSVAGYRVQGVGGMDVSPGGVVAFSAQLDNANAFVRYMSAGGNPETLVMNNVCCVYSVNDSGAALVQMNPGTGWGLYRWQGSTVTPILQFGRLAADAPVVNAWAGKITSRGEVITLFSTLENDFVVAKLGAVPTTLFQQGTRVDLPANLGMPRLIPGAYNGPPQLLMGSPSSLFRWESSALIPQLVVGDRLAGGSFFQGVYASGRHPDGDVYFGGSGAGIYRLSNGSLKTVLEFPYRLDDGVYVNNAWGGAGGNISVNSRGAMLFGAYTCCGGNNRLVLFDNSRLTSLAADTGNAFYNTASPGGGTFQNWREYALNDRGEALAYFNVQGGPSGLFLHSSGRWQALVLENSTKIDGRTVTNVSNITASGDSFFAIFDLSNRQAVAEYRNQAWTLRIVEDDIAPDGSRIRGFGRVRVNRRGDLAVICSTSSEQAILLRTAEGFKTVALGGQEFLNFQELDFRDDGRIYFTVHDVYDRILLFLAEPQ